MTSFRRPPMHPDARVLCALLSVAIAGSCRCAPGTTTTPDASLEVRADAGDRHHARVACPVDWEALLPPDAGEPPDGEDAPTLDALELDAWLAATDRAIAEDRLDVALACAQEAARAFPEEPSVHRIRAVVLDLKSDPDGARAALDRALALDPDDPLTVLEVVDVLVRRGDDDSLEAAVAHCRRIRDELGVHDLGTVAGLAALEAAALNDLGRPLEAVTVAETALALDETRDDARLERAVALLETLRFDEARTALEETVTRLPDDPRALWYLAVLAEREGDAVRSRTLYGRAATLDPEGYPPPLEVDAVRFRSLVDAEVRRLEAEGAEGLVGVRITVEELPAEADLRAGEPVLAPTIVGLYRPPEEGAAGSPVVVLYRLGLLRMGGDEGTLRQEIRNTLLHELGHHAGEDDDALRDRGL